MAQPFGSSDPTQRHETQDQKNVQGAIEAGRKPEISAQSAEQSVGAQGGQPRQQASHLNVLAGLESSRRALSQSHGRCDPLIGTRARCAHCLGRLCIVAATFGLGTARTLLGERIAALGQHGNRLAFDRLAQRGSLDAHASGYLRRAKPLGKQSRALCAHLRTHHRRPRNRRVAKE